jgi:hypothetical protein
VVIVLRALLLAAGLVWVAPLPAETPEESFDRGNSAYEEEDFAAAAEAYRSVLRYGIRDSVVEYNLGNAEFRSGNLGRAILHFERARRLAPTDRDVLANLEFARSFCYERVEPPESASPLDWLSTVQDRLGADRQAWALLALVWVAGSVLLVGFARPSGWRAAHGWTLALVLVALVSVGSSWYVTQQRLTGSRAAVVLDDVVEILAGPGPNHPTLVTVHEGLTLEIRAERQDWLQVGLPNGLNGWIVRTALEPV